jgi:glycine cleavage system transcriptional repressor
MNEGKESAVLTATGADRIGLVERISEFIVQHHCNIEDSKMAVLCGEFALILLISGTPSDVSGIEESASELAKFIGLRITIRHSITAKPIQPSLPYRLTASCMDHPGVVHRLTSVLSNLAINIESMETKTYPAPVSGTPIFRLEAFISIPTELNINALRMRFAEIEREQNIDIDLALEEETG